MIDLDHGLDVLRIILRHTSADPIKGREIQTMTGVDSREVAELVSKFTRRGFMVCSCTDVYFHGTPVEFKSHLDKERDRAVQVLRKVNAGKRNAVNSLSLWEQEAA